MHCAQGKLDKCMPYYEKALAIDIKVYGEEHPDVAIDYNNIAPLRCCCSRARPNTQRGARTFFCSTVAKLL